MPNKQLLIANLTEGKRSPIFEVRQLKCALRMCVWPGAGFTSDRHGVGSTGNRWDGCKAERLRCASSNKWYWRDIAVKEALRVFEPATHVRQHLAFAWGAAESTSHYRPLSQKDGGEHGLRSMKRKIKTLPCGGPVQPPPLLIRSPYVFPEALGVAPQCHLNLSEAVSFPACSSSAAIVSRYFWMFNLPPGDHL